MCSAWYVASLFVSPPSVRGSACAAGATCTHRLRCVFDVRVRVRVRSRGRRGCLVKRCDLAPSLHRQIRPRAPRLAFFLLRAPPQQPRGLFVQQAHHAPRGAEDVVGVVQTVADDALVPKMDDRGGSGGGGSGGGERGGERSGGEVGGGRGDALVPPLGRWVRKIQIPVDHERWG